MNNIEINRKREPQIIFSAQILETKYVGELKGYYVKNTNTYNVLPFDNTANINEDKIYLIGFILPINPFNYVDKEIASQIKYLKTNESTPDEIVSKIQQALQNSVTENPFKYFGKSTSAEIIRGKITKQLREGGAIEIDSFSEEESDFLRKFELAIDSEKASTENNVFDEIGISVQGTQIKYWTEEVFIKKLYRKPIHIDPLLPDIVVGYWEDNELYFIQLGSRQECRQDIYSLKLDIFSRNTGILESDVMLEKRAMFIGCGSVGSLFALELAKAGVGYFLLIDNDIFGYHNICRHQCGIYDVGRYKTDALAERILQVNPYAKVVTKNMTVQDVPVTELVEFCNKNTIVIGGADNREGDLYANNLAQQIGMPFMSIGCWERAFAGEIFYCLPKNMPNYQDFMEVSGLLSARVNQNRRFYTTEDDLKKVTFEPGISADIDFVTIIAVKIALDILNIDNENYTQRLLPHLTQYTLICNTNNKQIGGETAEIFSYPLQVTTSITVPYSTK